MSHRKKPHQAPPAAHRCRVRNRLGEQCVNPAMGGHDRCEDCWAAD